MTTLSFSESEVTTLRFLADRFRNGGNWCGLSGLPCYSEIGEDETRNRLEKFAVFGLLDWDSSDSFTISPRVLDIVDQIDNPPARDYWQEWTVWFRGRKWSLPVLVLVVGLPAIVQWIDMLKAVLVWLGWGGE